MHAQSVDFPSRTCAGPPIRHQGIPFTAAAFIASFRISALRVTASIHYHALINICENMTTTSLVRATLRPPFFKESFSF